MATQDQGASDEPPHSDKAEQSVLGGLLTDNQALQRVAPLLTTQSFYQDKHRAIFAALVQMVKAGEPADPITLFEFMRKHDPTTGLGILVYLNELQASVASASNIVRYAQIVADHEADRALRAAGSELARIASDAAAPAAQRIERMAALLARVDKGTRTTPPPFRTLSIADLKDTKPEAPGWCWRYYVPLGLLTVLSGHGGVGKSLVALMLAVSVATGRPMFGLQTTRCRVAFYSGEDGANLLMHRLLWVCEQLQVDPDELDGWLYVLDATEGDPALFRDVQVAGQRIGAPTATHNDLAAYLKQHDVGLLVVDNMSDTFDGNEIERAKVRAFLRSLLHLRPDNLLTVVLLAHVDKGTARGLQAGSESYSGSTALHNSARSRLFLARDKDGTLRMEHQKWTMLGQAQPPLLLQWHDGGLPEVDKPANGYVQAVARSAEVRALLRLIDEFSSRGEWVSTSINSTTSAPKLLQAEPGYPAGRRSAEVQALLRDAERDRLLARENYTGNDRKPRERWAVTDAGRAVIRGAAAGAAGVR